MLFFRSEDLLDHWCRTHAHPKRPVVSMTQLWGLAKAWYSSRLDPDARRPKPDEMRAIFTRLGLEGPFWDPQADTF